MKRGKDDEKLLRPMFPRLHVNDTEKGGPRAPPRNKMALYEQFSIPSQRFNPGVQSLNPVSSSNTVSLPSSSQGTVPERNYILPVHLPPQAPTYQVENNISHQSDAANLNLLVTKPEQRKKVDEDDFRVPIYMNSSVGQSNDKTLKTFDGKKFSTIGPRYFECTIEVQNDCDEDPKQFVSPYVNIRKYMRCESNVFPNGSPSRDKPVKPARNISNGENIDNIASKDNAILNQEHQDWNCPGSRVSRLHQIDACLEQDHEAGPLCNNTRNRGGLVYPSSDTEKGDVLLPRGCFHSTADQNSPVEAIDDTDCHDTRSTGPLQENWDKSDNVSKISTVDRLLSQKISTDDVVEIIGQKRFWKARRSIINQQRVFAVQVFELHRLIKVQQLIAGSPDILLEDGAFLGKSSLTGSPPKKHTLEYVSKPQHQNLKCKGDSEKPSHKMECSAENAVGKTSLSSMKNGRQLPNHTPFFGNSHQINNPWYLHQSPGHQWLIPVMSPSEGLVYKPYAGPGFTGTTCGGYEPFGPGPLGGAFMNPAYGIPASHQGFGVPTGTPPSSHAYFPHYDMPVMAPAMSGSVVEQKNQFAGADPHGKNGHLSGKEANCNSNNNSHIQSSCNLPPVQKSRTISQSQVKKFQASKASELQGSTASSPVEMAHGISRTIHSDALPLVPAASPIFPEAEVERAPQSPIETRPQTRVIKVVPHNPRSATESAARIFRSIQEERRQYDSA
ncbi:hypothetical protein K1719_010843 [Acacia pycnantha]|nr:hypothetical protein K1719_010843 [Acacia pycnantha]